MKIVKNFPERFPIRYAIILREFKDDDDDFSNRRTSERKLIDEQIFRQFILLLQEQPLDRTILQLSKVSVLCRSLGLKVFEGAKLNAGEEWINEVEKYISLLYPEALVLTDTTRGHAYNLGLYSYAGAGEIPSFWKMYQKYDDKNFLGERFGFHEHFGAILSRSRLYERMMKGEVTESFLYEMGELYERPIYLTVPHSSLWSFLDKGNLEGVVPTYLDILKYKSFIEQLPIEDFDKRSVSLKEKMHEPKITIVLCRNWVSLFTEEILSLYRSSVFCKNCSACLPFNYKGKYCLSSPENKQCNRERARQRKKLSQEK